MLPCPVHSRTAAHNATPRPPRSRMFEVAHRVAARFQPAVRAAFIEAVTKLIDQIDAAALASAVAGGNVDVIIAAIASGGDLGTILDGTNLEQVLRGASTATGHAGADVLTGATGLTAQFNALHPNVVLYARQQAGELIVAVSEDVREAVRVVLAVGQAQGLTTVQQARALREIVGLPPNWAAAPLNLAQELREGRFTASRRLSASDKAQIRSRLARGTIDEEFIQKMQTRYTESLRNRRALNIARTETLRSAHHGQREGWKQAVDQGVLPDTVRRVIVVTADDRLRDTHAAVPGMNPDGRGLDELFVTPFGALMSPPWEPLCRCGVGLIFPRPSLRRSVRSPTPPGSGSPPPSPATPAIPTFQSSADVARWLKSEGIASNVSLSGMDVEVANQIARALGEARTKFGLQPVERVSATTAATYKGQFTYKYTLGPGGVRAYNRGSLQFSKNAMASVDHFIQQVAKANARRAGKGSGRFSMSEIPYDTAIHEIAHVLHYQKARQFFIGWRTSPEWQALDQAYGISKWHSDPTHIAARAKISEYSNANNLEYVAESFVAWNKGWEIHPDMKRFIEEVLIK